MAPRKLKLPDSEHLVKVAMLRKATRCFREAEAGLTRVTLAEALGVTQRTGDRVVELLERQGARFARSRRLLEGGGRVLVMTMVHGPSWDERVSPLAVAVLSLAQVPAEEAGGEEWRRLVELAWEAAGERLTHADRRLFTRLFGEPPRRRRKA